MATKKVGSATKAPERVSKAKLNMQSNAPKTKEGTKIKKAITPKSPQLDLTASEERVSSYVKAQAEAQDPRFDYGYDEPIEYARQPNQNIGSNILGWSLFALLIVLLVVALNHTR